MSFLPYCVLFEDLDYAYPFKNYKVKFRRGGVLSVTPHVTATLTCIRLLFKEISLLNVPSTAKVMWRHVLGLDCHSKNNIQAKILESQCFREVYTCTKKAYQKHGVWRICLR